MIHKHLLCIKMGRRENGLHTIFRLFSPRLIHTRILRLVGKDGDAQEAHCGPKGEEGTSSLNA